jgi:hypothetical protein
MAIQVKELSDLRPMPIPVSKGGARLRRNKSPRCRQLVHFGRRFKRLNMSKFLDFFPVDKMDSLDD